MYDSVFGFSTPPFASAPDPQCWVSVPEHLQALEAILHCLQSGRGIAILTAPAGMGKTMLCQRIAQSLPPQFRVVNLPEGRFDDGSAVLQAALFELGRPYQGMGPQELRLQFTAALKEIRRDCQGTVLILDEAHACSEDVLEAIRAATNLSHEGRPLLRVLLSGQFALEEKLISPALDALNQRIGCHVSLEPLTRAESQDYILHHLRRAGANPDRAVTPQALHTICHAAGGYPRCLNRLCDRSFELAASRGRKPLDDATVRTALEELKRLPLHWNEPPAPEADVHSHKEHSPPRPTNGIQETQPGGHADEPAGESAVIEFGAAEPLPSAAANSPPLPVAVERAAPITGTQTKPGPEPRMEEPEWTPVDLMPAGRCEPPADVPDVRCGAHAGPGSARIRRAEQPRGGNRPVGPTIEEAVDDHYAGLLAVQRRQPPARPGVSKAADRTADRRSASMLRANSALSPDEAVESLLKVVEEAEGSDESERPRFHSIEDYLQLARLDTVRIDLFEPDAPSPAKPREPDPRRNPPRESDLYARLRRLQAADE